MALPEGYGFAAGRSRATAIALLAAADAVGVEQWMIRATTGGYQVPEAVLDEYNKHLAEEDQAISSDEAPATIVGEEIPEGTVVTSEDAAIVQRADGTVETGTLTPDAAPAAAEQPKKSASRADWITFASTLPGWVAEDGAEDGGLSRNELVAKYGTN